MAGNTGGPWGGGGNSGGNGGSNGGGNRGNNGGGRKPGDDGPQIPEIDELVKKGQEQLRVLMGGRGGNGGTNGAGNGGGSGPAVTRGTIGLGVIAAAVLWGMTSFYTVRPEQQSIELFLGEFSGIGTEGLNFAPWPLVKAEVFDVTTNRTETIGVARTSGNDGLMLTTDENIVDIDFKVVWNITQPELFLFNLAEPEETISAVSESVMREIIAQSVSANINQERVSIGQRWLQLTQETLDSYDSGVRIVRINLGAADPPATRVDTQNIDGEDISTSPLAAYRDVQDAEQERIQLQNQADAYANRETARARGNAAQILEDAEGYRAEVVNRAQGEAARFVSVLTEYQKAPEVTRKRLYLETMEEVLGGVDKVIIDQNAGGQGVVPYLPLDQLRKPVAGGN